MIVVAHCQHCSGELMIENSEVGKSVECSWCTKETIPSVQTHPLPLIEPETAPARNTPKRPPATVTLSALAREHIKTVRRNTCYGPLRGTITLVFGFAYVFLAIFFVAAFTAMFSAGPAVGIGGCAGSVLFTVFTVASHQASLLLIDIADSIIYLGVKS